MSASEGLQHGSENNTRRGGLLLASHRGLLVVRSVHDTFKFRSTGLGDRGEIKRFTEGSARRMSRFLRDSVAEYRALITLTYPYCFPVDGRESKNHLRRFVQELKRRTERERRTTRDFSVFWFMEFQSRGAIHYHLFSTDYYPREWIALTWYRIVGSDDERHLGAGTRIEKIRSGRGGTICYARKYAVKAEQKDVPPEIQNAGRFWGVTGNRSTVAAAIRVKSSALNDSRVSGMLEELKNTLKEGKKAGKVKVLPVKEVFGSRVYVLKPPFDAKVRLWFEKAEVKAALYDGLIFRTEERHEVDELEPIGVGGF